MNVRKTVMNTFVKHGGAGERETVNADQVRMKE